MDIGVEAKQALTLKEFCEAFAISRSYAYLEIRANRLIVKKAGRRTLVLRQDADAWANALPSIRRGAVCISGSKAS